MARLSWRTEKVSITLPKRIVQAVDGVADEVEISRSEVIADILERVISNEDLLNEIYPSDEGDEKEEEK